MVKFSGHGWALCETSLDLVLETNLVLLPEVASELLARFCCSVAEF